MLQLLEILPVVAFVLVYSLSGHTIDIAGLHFTLDGIYSATAVLMAATALQVAIVWLWKRTVEKRLLWLLALVLVFGSATLLLHNPLFLFWKPTVFNWALCLLLLGSHWLGKHNLIEKALGGQFTLPPPVYTRLAYTWAAYFFLVGTLNLVVAFHFSEAFWVKYKLWSGIAFTVLMMIITAVILAPHVKDLPDNELSDNPLSDNKAEH